MFAPEIPDTIVPLPLYRPRHRGIARECAACGRREDDHPASDQLPFFDGTDPRPIPAPKVVRGSHRADVETMVGP